MASGAPAKAGFAPGGHSSPRGGMADLMKEAGEARILKKLSFEKRKWSKENCCQRPEGPLDRVAGRQERGRPRGLSS